MTSPFQVSPSGVRKGRANGDNPPGESPITGENRYAEAIAAAANQTDVAGHDSMNNHGNVAGNTGLAGVAGRG